MKEIIRLRIMSHAGRMDLVRRLTAAGYGTKIEETEDRDLDGVPHRNCWVVIYGNDTDNIANYPWGIRFESNLEIENSKLKSEIKDLKEIYVNKICELQQNCCDQIKSCRWRSITNKFHEQSSDSV